MQPSNPFTPQERLESVKAGLVAGTAALLFGILLLLWHRIDAVGWPAALAMITQGLGGQTFWISSAIAALSGALFGLNYRYAVRQDNNPQLKSGVVLAFGLVRGLALVDVGSALNQHFWPFLAAIGESLLLFAIVAALLDWGLSQGWLKPFASR
ncbi:MAG: hypothetical protein AAF215_11430 [Cyanobacteria bacterium P01_A01_bin.123]